MPKVNTRQTTNGRTIYYVRTRDALGRQTSERFDTKTAAERFAKRVERIGGPAAIAERNRVDRAADDYTPTLTEYLPQHITQLTGVTDRTRHDYLLMANRTFTPILGELPLDGIDRTAIARCINQLEKQGLSAKSIANAHGLLSSVMATAVMNNLIGTNPCHRIRLPKASHTVDQEPRFLTHDEFWALEAQFPTEHVPMLTTMFGTGVRWSEVTALQVGDALPPGPPTVRFPLGTPPRLRVSRAWKRRPGEGRYIGPPKSEKSRRTVVLADQVWDALQPLLDRPAGAWLFTAARGGAIQYSNWRERVWVPAVLRADLGRDRAPTPHDARHTHASWLIEQGATLEMVQDQLGHESILTTRKVYGHLQPAMRAALADAATRAMAMGAAPLQIED